jgi:hypothetical protein
MHTGILGYQGKRQQFSLPVNHYMPGIYLIELTSEGIRKVIRWVKL